MIIYCTTNLINGKKYIGQDSNNNPAYLGSGKYLLAALKKYGKQNFQKELLQNCLSQQDLDESEAYWIDYFNAHKSDLFYNIASDAYNWGKRFVKGQTAHNKGKKHSEETRKRLSESHKGIRQSRETKQKRVDKLRGRKRADWEIEKIKLSNPSRFRGQKHREESKKLISGVNSKVARKIVQLDLKGNFIKQFDCISDATRFINKKAGFLWSVLAGVSKTSYGFKWMYLEDYNKSK